HPVPGRQRAAPRRSAAVRADTGMVAGSGEPGRGRRRPRFRPLGPHQRPRRRGRAAPAALSHGARRRNRGHRLGARRGHDRRPHPADRAAGAGHRRKEGAAVSIRIMMVDDHPVVRAGLRALLEADEGIEVVAEVGSGAEGLRVLDELTATADGEPDLVLMDLNLGDGIGGIETTRTLRERHPGVQVLAVTTFDAEADIVGALEAGATGYVLKDSPTQALIEAVSEAAAGRSILSPEVQQRLVRRMTSPHSALSPRESEILEALATG